MPRVFLRICRALLLAAIASVTSNVASAQAWRNCIPNSIGPGGCDSIGPGGGQSIGPGGGQSIGPGGGLSIGPGGGQSIGPGGGQSIGPGGGKALDRDRSRGLDPDTLRPYSDAVPGRIGPAAALPSGALRAGMTQAEVLRELGSPVVREAGGSQEAWHWCKTGSNVDQFFVVIFDGGRALGGRAYQVSSSDVGGRTGHCSLFTRKALR